MQWINLVKKRIRWEEKKKKRNTAEGFLIPLQKKNPEQNHFYLVVVPNIDINNVG